jgi:hypothetical protein
MLVFLYYDAGMGMSQLCSAEICFTKSNLSLKGLHEI